MKTKELVFTALFSALIAVCAWITIPAAVPFTLQTFAVLLAVLVLGGRKGTFAILAYILLGLVGVPVFSGFQGGPGVLLGRTGGYIIGFIGTGLTMGGVNRLAGGKPWVKIISMILGMLVCYAIGTAWFMAVYLHTTGPVSLASALSWCVLPFLLPDVLKAALAYVLSIRLKKALKLD